jgi:RNA recognition motif-containing protein
MKKLFIGNLPPDTRENDLVGLFETYGKVRSCKIVTDMFTRKCKGFGFIEMEGHEARAAIAGLNAADFQGNTLKVSYENTRKQGRYR